MRLPDKVLVKVTATEQGPSRKYIFTDNDVWLHSHCSVTWHSKVRKGLIFSQAGHLGVSDSVTLRRNGIAGLSSMAWETDRLRIRILD